MKIKNPVAFALPMFLGAGLALAVGACAEDAKTAQETDSSAMQPAAMRADHAMPGHSAGSMELHRIMTEGSKSPMPMSGDVDKDFAAMMTLHHQTAIDMADGSTRWTARDGAMGPVVVAGNSLFLVNDENQLLRLDAATGQAQP